MPSLASPRPAVPQLLASRIRWERAAAAQEIQELPREKFRILHEEYRAMRKDKKLGRPIIPGCGGGRLTDAYRLLAEVYQLLNEYAPVWYREDLQYRLQATLRPPDRALG